MTSPEGRDRSLFVGREREMGDLVSALDNVTSGRGRLVMLAGEPGIGKTRMAQEISGRAEESGVHVVWGRCYEGDGAPPFWPWTHVIGDFLRGHDADALRALMGPGAADIAEAFPDLSEKLPDLEPPPALEPQQARFRLFASVTSFLRSASEDRPLMLVLDDLHWADTPSLLLLEHLAQEVADSRILLLGTYRDVELSRQHPLYQTLGGLTRQGGFSRVLLRGLAYDEVGALLESTSGDAPVGSLIDTVHSQTEGNPFFVTEIARLIDEEQAVDGDAAIRIPEGVKEAIGRRLNNLSESCNRMLTVASVIGREFSIAGLERIADGIQPDEIQSALDEAADAGILEESETEFGRYSFAHTLTRETLVSEIRLSTRVRMHARIVTEFEEMYGTAVESHASELAYHASQAEAMIGPESMIRYSIIAGDQALERYAWEEALGHFEKAIEARDQGSMDDESARLLFGLARAQLSILPFYRKFEAIPNLTKAFEFYESSRNIGQAVAVAVQDLPTRPGYKTAGDELVPRALSLVPPDSLLAGRLLACNGLVESVTNGNYPGAREAFNRALEIGIAHRDPLLQMLAQTYMGLAGVYHVQYQDTVEASQAVLTLSSELDAPVPQSLAHYFRSYALLATGDMESARHHMSACLALSERTRDRYRTAQSTVLLGYMSLQAGDVEEYRASTERGTSLEPLDPVVLLFGCLLETLIGDFSAADSYNDRLLDIKVLTDPRPNYEYAIPAVSIPYVARWSGDLSRLQSAKECGDVVISSPNPAPYIELTARLGLALSAVLAGDKEETRRQYGESIRLRESTRYTVVSVDSILGMLAHSIGDLTASQSHFEDSLTYCQRGGFGAELALAQCDYADMLLDRKEPGDQEKATSMLDEALQKSTDLGMKPLTEKIIRLQEDLRAESTAASEYPDGLTEREVEVLRLVASGMSNREIAEDLIVSVYTVNRHVSNIFSKTDSANRAEAATYASQHGLV